MQTQQRPRFRQDLVAEPVDDNGARFIDVLDPDRGNVFRFYEVEYSLACAMDGERDVAGIVQWAREELGLTPSPNEVKTVITTLGDLGYLEGTAVTAAQPTGRPAQQTGSLAPGIVVGERAPMQSGVDMELGHVAARSARDEQLPEAPDLELGAPGTVPSHRGPPTTVSEDIALGQSGRGTAAMVGSRPQVSDVSLDLSEEMSIGRDDVKEAVRQSQVMRAVDVPPELRAATEASERASEAKKPAEEPRTETTSEPRIEPKKPLADQPRTESRPKPAVDLPKQPKQPQPSQPRGATVPPRSVSPVFILLLVLAVVSAGAFFAWKYLLNKENKQQQSVVPPPPVEPVKPEPVKPAAPPETAKLTSEQPDPQELKPTAAGLIETILAKDAVVKPGDVVARLAGNKPLETEVLGIQRDIEKRVQPELAQAEKDRDAAQAAGNKAAGTTAEARIADRKKSLEDKQGKLAAKQAELDKYLIKSPVDGKVTAPTKASTRVTPSDSVAKIVRPLTLVTTLHSSIEVAPNTKVILKVAGATEQKLTCTATTTSADGVRIVCPGDVAAPGAEVMLIGADASQPATTNGSGSEIEMADEGSGAAAGSAATGSAATARSGSAKATAKVAPARPRPAPARPSPKQPQPKPPEGSDKAVDTTTTPAPPPAVAPAGSDATK